MATGSSAPFVEKGVTSQSESSLPGALKFAAAGKTWLIIHQKRSGEHMDYNIHDLQGRQLFQSQFRPCSLSKEQALLDVNGAPIFSIKSIGEYRKEISKGGTSSELVAVVKKKFKLFLRSTIKIKSRSGGNGELYKVKGGLLHREFSISEGNRPVAILILPGRWGPKSFLEVSQGVDMALMTSLAIAILDIEKVR